VEPRLFEVHQGGERLIQIVAIAIDLDFCAPHLLKQALAASVIGARLPDSFWNQAAPVPLC
jgi:hypothetical protein